MMITIIDQRRSHHDRPSGGQIWQGGKTYFLRAIPSSSILTFYLAFHLQNICLMFCKHYDLYMYIYIYIIIIILPLKVPFMVDFSFQRCIAGCLYAVYSQKHVSTAHWWLCFGWWLCLFSAILRGTKCQWDTQWSQKKLTCDATLAMHGDVYWLATNVI